MTMCKSYMKKYINSIKDKQKFRNIYFRCDYDKVENTWSIIQQLLCIIQNWYKYDY